MTPRGREMRRASALLLLSLLPATLLAGCLDTGTPVGSSIEASAEAASGGSTGAAQGSTSATGGVPESTVGVASGEDLAGAADASVPFVARTEAGGGSGYDADSVLAVRYGVHEGYERAVIDLGTGEEPAGSVPKWTLASPKGDGLLRVTLPSASVTCVSDGKFGDGLLGSFHVVRAPEGGMFVDFFARKAFLYRVLELQDPARLVVDFKPTGASLTVPLPAEGGGTVLVEPRSKATISDPLTVSGYSRNFEATNTITLTNSDGKVLVRRTVRSNDWSSTWGYFEATFDLPQFAGKGTLKVGTQNARDGSFDGVEIPVRAR
ncbi:MAG TPA: Gmad2 immunoglobulin-like domain-containing protein [Rubrobacter sp.]|nr:Gmad2 immunoglobulin-like domain-containing protein [Rubrobacter sp.]